MGDFSLSLNKFCYVHNNVSVFVSQILISQERTCVFSSILITYSSRKLSLLDLIYVIFDQQGNRNLIKNQEPQLMR